MQCPHEKHCRVRGYRHSINQLQTSPTPPLPRKNVQHACCTLYSMPSLYTVWCANQSRVLYFACRCTTLHHLHNTNANSVLVPQYKNVSVVVKLRVVGKHCHTSCTTSLHYMYHWIVHVALSHCAFSTLLVDFHTLYDQPFGPSARAFSLHWCVCMLKGRSASTASGGGGGILRSMATSELCPPPSHEKYVPLWVTQELGLGTSRRSASGSAEHEKIALHAALATSSVDRS